MKVYLLDKLVAMLILILNFEIWLYANYDVEQNVKVSSSIATDLILVINQKLLSKTKNQWKFPREPMEN